MNSETPTTTATRTIKRFAPLRAGKIAAVLYGAMGLIFAPFGLALAFFELAAPTGIATLIGLGLAIIMPIFYGICGFVVGVITAWLYNVTVRFTGGMEVEFESAV